MILFECCGSRLRVLAVLSCTSKQGYNCVYLLAPVAQVRITDSYDRSVASNYRNTDSFVNRGPSDRTIRVIIAEDHTLMAQGLRKLLECEFESVTIVGNGRELIDSVAVSNPDVALVDIVMPLVNSIEATRRLRKTSPATKVVIVTAHADPQYVVEAFRAGASGFVLKSCAVSELVVAIRAVLSGQTYITPLLAHRAVATAAQESAPGPVLTSRQREVLQLVAEGCTAKEIANVLKLSVKTAVFHKMAIMEKLGLRTTAELTRYAMEHGIATTTPSLRAKAASNVPR
jgi:DNA-binding NarL/FixJ family response regulator